MLDPRSLARDFADIGQMPDSLQVSAIVPAKVGVLRGHAGFNQPKP